MTHEHRSARRQVAAGLAALAALALTFSVRANSAAPPEPEAPAVVAAPSAFANQYIGSKKCKNCHSTEETGDQYGKWAAGPHAKAFETLASADAKKAASAAGIEDPQKADECMRCHQTAFGVAEAEIKKGFDPHMGVQCESCHGPGKDHMMARMKAAAAAAEGPVVLEAGEISSDVKPETCTACHNDKSPSYKPFCFHEFEKQIRHLNPKKERTPEELAALDACHCDDSCVCKKDSPDKKCRSAGK